MVGSCFLAKTAPWNRHDACFIYHLHAVEKIRLFALSLRIVNKLLWEMDLRKRVHRTLDFGTTYIFHLVKCIRQQLSSFFKSIFNLIVLLQVLINTSSWFYALCRWVNHQVDGHLAGSVRAQLNRLKFVKMLFGCLREIMCFHISTSKTAFT